MPIYLKIYQSRICSPDEKCILTISTKRYHIVKTYSIDKFQMDKTCKRLFSMTVQRFTLLWRCSSFYWANYSQHQIRFVCNSFSLCQSICGVLTLDHWFNEKFYSFSDWWLIWTVLCFVLFFPWSVAKLLHLNAIQFQNIAFGDAIEVHHTRPPTAFINLVTSISNRWQISVIFMPQAGTHPQ